MMKGYTATELLVTLVVIAVIITVAVPVYRNYLDSSKAADTLETIAVLEEQLTILASTEEGKLHVCDDLLAHGGLDNLYVTQGIVPLPGGEAGLQISAKIDTHGGDGIQVAKSLLEELNGLQKPVDVSVNGQTIVSYTVRLTPEGRAFCDTGATMVSQGSQPTSSSQSTPPPAAQEPGLSFSFTTSQQVLEFPDNGRGSVINNGPLQTGGPIRDLAVEFNVMGGQQVTTSGYHGATFLSYGTSNSENEFYAWKPSDLTVRINGTEYATGIDTTDGQSHRYSILWSSDTGRLQVLVDGTPTFTKDGVGRGYEIPGGGVLALAQDQDRFQIEDGSHANNHGFSPNDAFHGQYFSASMANAKVDPATIQNAPLAAVVSKDQGLITDIRMSGGKAVDLTGNHQLTSTGMNSRTVPVDTSIATPNPGASLELSINVNPKGKDQLVALSISGFISGTQISDSSGKSSTGSSQDILNWDYSNLTAKLPDGRTENMRITVSATVRGPAGDQASATTERTLVLDPTQPI